MIELRIAPDTASMGEAAAREGAETIRAALAAHGEATIIVATGASQFSMLASLVRQPGIDWSRVTAFHLDEYVGLPETHGASFRRYLRERFLAPLGDAPRFIPVDGSAADPAAEARRLGALIRDRRIDVCFAGIGENCHLAFNDPPADFEATEPYIVVELDQACRQQQFGEGWFESLDAVPRQAISMSIPQILRSRRIILSVPDARKAVAVRDAVEGPVSPLHPASILQGHAETVLFLDPPAASLLRDTAA
jgi:glucosamine-6-phosphate deaminase